MNPELILSAGGLVIGLAFGAIVTLTNFCTIGAIADVTLSDDWRRLRSWILAAAVALAGAQALDGMGLARLAGSAYLAAHVDWLGSLGGGLLFGIGMALAGGCPSRGLARAAGGDLRAVTVLFVMALFAHVTISGPLGPLRRAAEAETIIALPAGATSSLADLAGFALGGGEGWLRLALAGMLTSALLLVCFVDPAFRASPRHILAGLGVGLCAVAGWTVTGAAQDDFALAPTTPASISFIRPVAESMDYLMRATGIPIVGFGVALVAGCLLGALAVALANGRFAVRGFADSADTIRNLAGAAMMGIGGVFALGCSIGQGVSGVSTMALPSFLAAGAMAAGGVIGLKFLESRV